MKKERIHNIDKSGFKTPKGYFSNLEDTMMSQIHLDKKINKSGFKMPENYFETLDNKIISQISEKQKPKVISLISKRNIIAISSVAAAVILLFNLNLFNKHMSFDMIESDALENYVSNQEFETLDLEPEIIEDIDISTFILEESISDVTLENYLINVSEYEDYISE